MALPRAYERTSGSLYLERLLSDAVLGHLQSSAAGENRACPFRGRAAHPGGARRGRDARHPNLRQLHPERDGRPFRRRRGRRGGGPTALCRDPAAMVLAAHGVRVRAAQVQGRGDRGAERPRRHQGLRHRARGEARSSPSRTSSPIARPSCASTTSKAAATTSTRRASRSSSTSVARSRSPAPSKPSSPN
jgi:hypothetical protein